MPAPALFRRFLSLVIDKVFRELLLQGFDLGAVTHLNVGILRMVERIVLVIIFSAIESLERRHLSHNRFREDFGLVQLLDVSRGYLLLFFTRIKDGGTIRRANVRPLPVEFCRIVRHGKEDSQQLPVCNL